MPKQPGGKNVVSAVQETLDSVVTPSVRDTILARALAAAERREVPTEPAALEEFLQGPMHDTLVRALGPELGTSVSSELERITGVLRRESGQPREPARAPIETVRPGTRARSPSAASRRKRSTMPSPDALPPGSAAVPDAHWAERERHAIAPTLPAARPTPARRPAAPARRVEPVSGKPAPLPSSADYPRGVAAALGVVGTASVDPSPERTPTVLLATTDPELLRLFKAWLDLRATVEETTAVTSLITRVGALGGRRAVVVLDGKHPGIRPLSLAAIADELPPGTTVILWGVPPHLQARMCTVSAAAERFLVYAGDTTSNEVVAECAKLLG